MKVSLAVAVWLLVSCGGETPEVTDTIVVEESPVTEHVFSGQEKVLNDAKSMEQFISDQDAERRKKLEAMQ
ncbi:MAG: hypothetical protein HOM11_00925 [Methylococcales bacterium]|jgi:hypothetical protein|nr:hypothetical protein [Methylococcales bacterium]MBT7442376.1 hypothetical protein [Methylococcales bacterium]